MKSDFSRRHPDFAVIEHHIRRAQAERAVYIGTLIADAIVAGIKAVRGLARTASPAPHAPRPLVVKASLPR